MQLTVASIVFMCFSYAEVAELADAHDSKSCGKPWGFESLLRHQLLKILEPQAIMLVAFCVLNFLENGFANLLLILVNSIESTFYKLLVNQGNKPVYRTYWATRFSRCKISQLYPFSLQTLHDGKYRENPKLKLSAETIKNFTELFERIKAAHELIYSS